jgi:ABC-2 type transport system permease protein
MQVGSLPWLLRHELRLWWRDLTSRPGVVGWAIAIGILFAGLFFLLWVVLSSLRELMPLTVLSQVGFWFAAGLWVVGFCYAFIQSIKQSIIALFDRGDLDLLISSPVSSKVIFASRLLGVALAAFLNYCPIVVPASLLAVALGFPQLLGIYPALAGLTLYAASLAMLLTVWLVRRLGARQARTFVQVIAVFLTGILFLGTQLPNLLAGTSVDHARTTGELLQSWFGSDSFVGENSPIWFPARAIFFDLGSVLLTLLTSGGLAWLTVETLHHSFIVGTQQSVTLKQKSRTAQETRFARRFESTVLLKEWRIICRNPYLISSTFLQILFLIPALIILLRGNTGGSIANVTSFVTLVSIVVGESLTQTLVRICLSGEEAPDLLKSSPVKGAELRRLKLLAALIPVWVLLSPLFIILIIKGESWFLSLIAFLAATTCAAVLRLWNSQPIPLSDLFKRRQNLQGDLVLGILEAISLFMWACLGLVLSQGAIVFSLMLLLVIALTVAIAYWRSQQLGTSLGF